MHRIIPFALLAAMLLTAGSGLALIEAVGELHALAEGSADDALAGDVDGLAARAEGYAFDQAAEPLAQAGAAAADPPGYVAGWQRDAERQVSFVSIDDMAVDIAADMLEHLVATPEDKVRGARWLAEQSLADPAFLPQYLQSWALPDVGVLPGL